MVAVPLPGLTWLFFSSSATGSCKAARKVAQASWGLEQALALSEEDKGKLLAPLSSLYICSGIWLQSCRSVYLLTHLEGRKKHIKFPLKCQQNKKLINKKKTTAEDLFLLRAWNKTGCCSLSATSKAVGSILMPSPCGFTQDCCWEAPLCCFSFTLRQLRAAWDVGCFERFKIGHSLAKNPFPRFWPEAPAVTAVGWKVEWADVSVPASRDGIF